MGSDPQDVSLTPRTQAGPHPSDNLLSQGHDGPAPEFTHPPPNLTGPSGASLGSGPASTHFFSFSPTAGDAAGLVSFSLGGDGEWLWLWLWLRLRLLLRLWLRLPLRVRLRLREGLRDQLLRLRLLLWCLGPRAPRL